MTGVPPRRPAAGLSVLRAVGGVCAVVFGITLAVFPVPLPAQSPADQPALPASPDTAPSVSTDPDAAQLPPYAPSNNAASPLLPASPPLPPHPSIPTLSLLPPDSTPPPAVPLPLPVPEQTGSQLSPTASGTVLTNGAPGTTPATELPGGASTTGVTADVRRFQYAFRLSTGLTYDDNIFLTSDDTASIRRTPGAAVPINNTPRSGISRSDLYFTIDPSVSLGYGDFLTRATNYVEFDYNADVLLYTKNTDQDTVQHFINLQGAYHFAQVTLTLSQGVQILDSTEVGSVNTGSQLGGSSPSTPSTQVNLDASQRTALNIFSTRLSANYAFSQKTSVDLDGYFSADDYQTLISSDTFSADSYFNYSPTGKITLGLGVTGGYVIQDESAPNEFFQEINLRLSYAATGKLSLAGTLGVESREIGGHDGGTEVTPVFDLTVSYTPFDSTSLALTASRSIETSAVLTGADFDSTGFSFTISQRFFQRVYTRLSLGYTYSSYVAAGTGASINRTDNYYFVQPALDYSIRQYLTADVFYSHRQSSSSLSGNGFSDNQIGVRLSLSF